TCMKMRTTSVAFTKAIPIATTLFSGPRSMKAAKVVVAVRASSATNTREYVLTGTTCTLMLDHLSERLAALAAAASLRAMLTAMIRASSDPSAMPPHEVQERKQEDPDDID